MAITLDWHGDVLVAAMRNGDNRLNVDTVGILHEAAAQLESRDGPRALVLTGADKFFSNGLDLDRFAANPHELGETVELLCQFFGRALLLPCATVAAINGHAFAGGALLTSVFNYRIMRADRGFWCLPEVDLQMPFTDGLFAGLSSHLSTATLVEAMTTGRRFDGPSALVRGIVNELVDGDGVLDRALDYATEQASKSGPILGGYKVQLFGDLARRAGWSN
jgi:enoyl-CoA hydratase/carnithine racemase